MTRPPIAKPWKPTRCGCGARNPSFNRDGGRDGTPWRCAKCDATAQPLPETPFSPDAPNTSPQGSLL